MQQHMGRPAHDTERAAFDLSFVRGDVSRTPSVRRSLLGPFLGHRVHFHLHQRTEHFARHRVLLAAAAVRAAAGVYGRAEPRRAIASRTRGTRDGESEGRWHGISGGSIADSRKAAAAGVAKLTRNVRVQGWRLAALTSKFNQKNGQLGKKTIKKQ